MEIHSDHRPYPAHNALLDVLRGDVSPDIEEFDCGEDCVTEEENKDRWSPNELRMTLEDIGLIRRAIDSSPWIHQAEKQEYLDSVQIGNEDAALCILIPLLTNLRWLQPPINTKRLQQIIGCIAKAYHDIDSDSHNADTCHALPLTKLVLVSTRAYNGTDFGMNLETAAYYAALPRLQRLIIYCCRDDEFKTWPAKLPPSRLREVFFADSCVSLSAAQAFLKGFAAQCIIRQTFGTNGSRYRVRNEWDHCEAGGDLDSAGRIKDVSRWEKCALKYDDEYHGYSAPTWGQRRDSDFSEIFNQLLDSEIVEWKNLTS